MPDRSVDGNDFVCEIGRVDRPTQNAQNVGGLPEVVAEGRKVAALAVMVESPPVIAS